jgi:predicted ester cyclase
VKQPSSSVVARWLAAGDSGDVEAFEEFLHGDVVVHAPRGLSTDSREAEKRVWREALAAMPDLHHEVQEVLVQGDVEMARVIVTGTIRRDFAGVSGGGRSFRMDQAVICHLVGDKIAEAWEIADVRSLDDHKNARLDAID